MSRHPKLQRITSMSVPALLAANAMVLVLGLATFAADHPAGADTIYIKNADGTLTQVDPNTAEGWKAIADAEQHGGQGVNGNEQPVTPTSTKPLKPAAATRSGSSAITVPDLSDTVDGV